MKTREKIMLYALLPFAFLMHGVKTLCKCVARKSKPAIAMLVAVTLMLSVMPMTAFAADYDSWINGATISVGTYDLNGTTITINGKLIIDGDVIIKNGTIKRDTGFTGTMLTVGDDDSLTLEHVTIDGGAVWSGTTDSVLQRGTTNAGISSFDVLLYVDGSVSLNEGTVLQNNCVRSSVTGTGGAITVRAGGSLEINGATIRNNANMGENGGAIKTYGAATITMNDGEIYGNSAYGHGGAVQIWANTYPAEEYAVFTMNGGVIRNNRGGTGRTAIGGGVVISNYSAFIMNGGSIIDNATSGNGGGVAFSDDDTSMSVSGDAVISGNKSGSTENNLYIGSKSCNILTVGEMTYEANIGIRMAYGTGVFTQGGADYYGNFKSDNTAYTVMFSGDNLKIDAHNSHSFRYTVSEESESQITQMCTCGHKETVTLKSDADAYKYTGSPLTPVTAVYSDGWSGEKNAEIQYVGNTNVGTAKATLTIGGKTIEKTFKIVKGDAPVITFPEAVNSITYGQPIKDAGLTFTSNEYGTFNWTGPNGIANAGIYGHAVDFVPNSDALNNYDWASLDGQNGLQWIEGRQALCAFVDVTINKADADYTAPTANNLTYNRVEQNLVATGTVSGGTMEYVLGTDSTTAPTTGWSETVPQGKNAGTYYVWYKVVGDRNHNDVTPACVPVTIARKDISTAEIIGETEYYTGEAYKNDVFVYLDGVLLKASDCEYEYSNNVNVGTATVVATGVGNYTGTVTGHFNIEYYPYAENATVEGTLGQNGWYIGEVTLKAPQGFKIATSQDGEWLDTISVNTERDGNMTYYLKSNLNGFVGQKNLLLEIDLSNPNAEISIGENRWNSFLNTITFGLFFKETKTVSIVASDTMSYVARIEYVISDGEITEFDDIAWNLYSGAFNIQPNSKNVIYAKVTDDSGRYTIVNTDGIVLYTDSVALTDSIVTTYKAGVDKSVAIKLNGNQIREVRNGNTKLDSNDYEISLDGDEITLTLKASYLDTLNAGSYTFTVSYNPLGEIYDYGMDGDEPTNTDISVVIQKAESSVVNISSLDKTYDGSAVSAPTYSVVGDGTVTVEYKLKDADDSAYTTVAPKDAGKYVVRISVAATENYNATSKTADFEIAKKSVMVTATAPDKVYDGTNDVDESAITLEFRGIVAGESVGFSVKESWYNGASVGDDKVVPIVFNVTGDDAKNYTFPTGAEYVAPDYYVEALADITQKELNIVWGDAEFTYDGNEKFPEFTVQGIIDGDVVEFTCIGAATDARHEYVGTITSITGEDSANYKLIETPTKEFVINKADQTAPAVSKVDETISGKNDGKITDVSADMEYRADGEDEYTSITGTTVENLADGRYYVRLKGDNNHNPSPDTEITISAGRMLVVTYKADGAIIDSVEVEYDKDASAPAIPEKEGYTQTAPTWDKDGKNITEDTEINAVYTINEYTITFVDENGTYKTVTVKHGESVEMPEAPTKDGYHVTWETTIDKATGDATIKAVYTEKSSSSSGEAESPQTGDSSNLWLWIALAFVSGGLFFGTLYNKKKREKEEKE